MVSSNFSGLTSNTKDKVSQITGWIRINIDRKQREDYNLIAIERMHFYAVKHSSRAVSICLKQLFMYSSVPYTKFYGGMKMITVNAIGDACPIPVVKTKKAIEALTTDETVVVLVDNETALQNVTKAAHTMGFEAQQETVSDKEFKITIQVVKGAAAPAEEEQTACCCEGYRKNVVVAVSSNMMGEGSEELGKVLIKSFFFALTQQDELPGTIIFYNGGVKLSTEGSPVLEDLKNLAGQGVEIISCGTCLNFYQLSEKLAVGEVSNMYDIVEHLRKADLVIKP